MHGSDFSIGPVTSGSEGGKDGQTTYLFIPLSGGITSSALL